MIPHCHSFFKKLFKINKKKENDKKIKKIISIYLLEIIKKLFMHSYIHKFIFIIFYYIEITFYKTF